MVHTSEIANVSLFEVADGPTNWYVYSVPFGCSIFRSPWCTLVCVGALMRVVEVTKIVKAVKTVKLANF